MAEITAALVKELRDSTGAGMMDCKKALTEVGGDIDAAGSFKGKNRHRIRCKGFHFAVDSFKIHSFSGSSDGGQ